MEKCQRKIRPASLLLFTGLASLFNCQLRPARLWAPGGSGDGAAGPVPSWPCRVRGSIGHRWAHVPAPLRGEEGSGRRNLHLLAWFAAAALGEGCQEEEIPSRQRPAAGLWWALVVPPAGSTPSGGSTQGLKTGVKKESV